MIQGPEEATTLVARLELEYQAIENNWELNRQAWERIRNGGRHELDWSALGYTLHIVYTAMENYFLRISKAFENNLSGESWHRELVEMMQLDIPGTRPALLDNETAKLLGELRAFRHVFRAMYDDRLDPDRMELLQKKAPQMQAMFASAHRDFCAAVAEIGVGGT